MSELITTFSLEIVGLSLTSIGSILVIQFKELKGYIKEMDTSIRQLNINMARIMSEQVWHKEELTEIKSRLIYLEARGKNGDSNSIINGSNSSN